MSTQPQNSFQWMTKAGVNAEDVAWLAGMDGSAELHLPQHSERAERIFITAARCLLDKSAARAEFIKKLN